MRCLRAHVGPFNYGPPRNPGTVAVGDFGNTERMSDDPHETEEMKLEQRHREEAERRLAEQYPTDAGTAIHDRRAEKHAYLKEKLAEREQSERETD
jgi:hypothetical protein